MTEKFRRESGILLHITSLPGNYGIGEIGPSAFQFIDNLTEMGQKYWQILPMNPPDNFNCPYSATSAFANNPLLISLDFLVRDGYLDHYDLTSLPKITNDRVRFSSIIEWRSSLLKKATNNFQTRASSKRLAKYNTFCNNNKKWLKTFALFSVIQNIHNGADWIDWGIPYRTCMQDKLKDIQVNYSKELEEVKVLQYLFHDQWMKLKSYANSQQVQIIGDIPIYVSFNSADVWWDKEMFKLNSDGRMRVQSGCPPDFFIETGQVWGHPIYDWSYHKQSDFSWWVDRITNLFELVDIIRIDHFNGFAKYWEVPAKDNNGLKGKWVVGPGRKLFNSIFKKIGKKPIMAEDLGEASEEAAVLRAAFGIPGMKILQMSFSNGEPFQKLDPNNVVYTGTHDNDTTVGWFQTQSKEENTQPKIDLTQELENAKKVLNIDEQSVNWKMIEYALNTNANTAIIPMQDVLGLDSTARMNIPGTVGANWEWRMAPELLTNNIKQKLFKLTKKSKRL